MTQKIQKKTRMGKTEEDETGLQLEFLKAVLADRFSKCISVVCNAKYNT